ncbi:MULTISPECIES: thiamine/thiamine pyrophosphate ABC transporter permease [unclassified Mesorhizobium]|uniref:thiamine/thiamine pyrophosphate ABC transporter permease n=1 Tax=unclassified Mesorhizobium TaxID=325217 RepID=UPI000FDC6CB2|nr:MULTISPECIES: thiamine/thiamine pyrophosphate ABC transporter permease [unclassified Mesorhizobium]TGQ30469.1 thiamine/thiamine pyrophosphate ABC transporter, permease protein [Mesorhizobium sp. M00.F.Ca.ET.216.01.1.1]TIS56179.1 MAG: thiamine/thiamine pyrophosphate ABC transporter, permease protein [Mesorhizobium sp.]TIS87337.1 MAG: thiamine/thiamine pyrophosphate ABC transporter, permease protein [Mesorhizobium sp.]TJW16087.1 MAG: thiamine/thiamine pyrophosphate ABC transporter, permease pr
MQHAPSSDSRVTAGIVALAAIALLIGGAFAGLILEGTRDPSGAASAFDSYLFRVARFTLWQALLSTLLSVVPALLVARALSRHPRFFGRGFILQLFAVPLALPAIVAALGVLALYGRVGYFAGVLGTLGGQSWPGIYGLSGILVAHVFFNLPLATRLFLEALGTVPADQWRLASQLGMGARPAFRLVEWPTLRAALPGVAGLVFMLCITSFTIVLTLGGGPRATTLEVAIYQALRFDFDPARAVTLTLLQIGLTFVVVLALMRLGANTVGDANLPVAPRRYLSAGTAESVLNAAFIVLALLFVAGPMAATLAAGLGADLGRLAGESAVRQATLTSAVLALLSALLSVALSLSLVMARRALALSRRNLSRSMDPRTLLEHAADTGAGLVLVVPPIVVGAGWFLLLRTISDVFAIAPVMVVTVNAVMAMPFAIRALRPAYDAASERHERLCAQLGISALNRLWLIDWPSLRRPLATAFAFAMALSLGDLGVIALFGSDSVQTLPYLLLARMSSYRTVDAAGLALLLGVVCLALVLAADWLGRGERS